MRASKYKTIKATLNKDLIKTELESGNSVLKLSSKYKLPYETFKIWVKSNNLRPKHNIHHDYFSVWSSDMAYILGFITADGCIHGKRPYLTVELKNTDKVVLSYILSKIYPDGNIYECKHYDKRTKKTNYASKICLFSHKIKNDLVRYGVVPNKTGTHKLDFEIPKEYLGDYVRGFFDGDGTIYTKKYHITTNTFSKSVKIVCKSESFLKELRHLCKDIGHFFLEDNLYVWKMDSKNDIKMFSQIIYDNMDNKFCLERKRIQFNYE